MRQDPEGYARTLRSAGRRAGRGDRAHRGAGAAGHRRRGRRRAAAAVRAMADGCMRRSPRRGAAALRPLDDRRARRRVPAQLREFLAALDGADARRPTWPTCCSPTCASSTAAATQPFTGDVLVQGNRIARVVTHRLRRALACRVAGAHGDRRRRRVPDAGHGRGAHAFLLERPAEPRRDPAHAAGGAHPVVRAGGQALPRHGLDSCVGAAAAKPRLDVVIRNAINDGKIPGPRYLAASQEITVPGGLGDNTLPHLPHRSSPSAPSSAAPRRCAAACACSSSTASTRSRSTCRASTSPACRPRCTPFTEEEIAMCVDGGEAPAASASPRTRARAESVKQCVRHGIEVIYHASFADEEALDMLEAQQGQALRRARPRLADQHLAPRQRMGPDARGDEARWATTASSRSRSRRMKAMLQARHPHPARRRLRLRLDAARHQREGPRVLRQVPRHEHDGGAAVGHRVGRRRS